MTPEQIAERIDALFESQPDGPRLLDALEALQVELIGKDGLKAMRDRRHAEYVAYRAAHPCTNSFVRAADLARDVLASMRGAGL